MDKLSSEIKNFISILEDIKNNYNSKYQYEKENNHFNGYIAYTYKKYLKKLTNPNDKRNLTNLYKQVCSINKIIINKEKANTLFSDKYSYTKANAEEKDDAILGSLNIEIDKNERTETFKDIDEDGSIIGYNITLYKRDAEAEHYHFNRAEMEFICEAYNNEGEKLTARAVQQHFPGIKLSSFRRILRGFGITKDGFLFPEHVLLEASPEAIEEAVSEFIIKRQLRIVDDKKGNLKRACDKLATDNKILSEQLNNIKDIASNNIEIPSPIHVENNGINHTDLVLHLADLHIGAKVESNPWYENNWTEKDINNRLSNLLKQIASLGKFNTIVINLLGDMIDGMDNQTARRDHFMPQHYDNREQAMVFDRQLNWFVDSLLANKLCNKLKIMSVNTGNHGGDYEYYVVEAVLAKLSIRYPEMEIKHFSEDIGFYKFNGHQYAITHGKDARFMKRGMPKELNADWVVKINTIARSKGIEGNIILVKGDLHSNNFSMLDNITYVNTLSLFGASDYAQKNYIQVPNGVCYDLHINNHIIRGAFTNL